MPSADQLAAAEALIDSLDLSENATDEEEFALCLSLFFLSFDHIPSFLTSHRNTIESLNPRYTYNPTLQRLYQTLHQRALDPSLPLGPLDPIIEKFVSLLSFLHPSNIFLQGQVELNNKTNRYVNPDEELFVRSKAVIDNFRKAFPLEKIIGDRLFPFCFIPQCFLVLLMSLIWCL